MLNKYIFINLIFPTILLSESVGVLPAIIQGRIPENYSNIYNFDRELSKVSEFYILHYYNFQLVSIPVSNNFNATEISRNKFKSICENLNVNFVIQDEFFFNEKIGMSRTLYNCLNNTIREFNKTTSSNLLDLIEKNNQKSFEQYSKKVIPIYYGDKTETLTFFLDCSPSFSKEINTVIKLIKSNDWKSTLNFRFVLINGQNTSFIQDIKNSSELNQKLNSISYSGKSTINDLTNSILKYFRNSNFNKTNQKVFIFTNSKFTDSESNYISALKRLKTISNKIYLFTGKYFDKISWNTHAKAIRAVNGELIDIEYFQKVSTVNENFYLVLKNGILYRSNQNEYSAFENSSTKIFSLESNLTPYNMVVNYEKAKKEKITSKEEIENNLSFKINSIIKNFSNTESNDAKYKLLVKTNGNAFWLYSNQPFDINSKITFKTTFIKNQYSTYGVVNLPNQTSIYNFLPSELLLCDPFIAKNQLASGKNQVHCLMKAEILQIESNE